MSSLREVQDRLGRLRRDGPLGQPLHHWGFTVYRTVYPDDDAPDSDQEMLWQALLKTISSEVRSSILPSPSLRGDPPDEEFIAAGEKLAAQFRLEIKDDKATLNGKSMREVRELAMAEKAAIAEAAGNVEAKDYDDDDKAALRRHSFLYHKALVFLYVDEQVLAQFREGGQQQQPAASSNTTTTPGSMTNKKNTPWIKVGEVDYEPESHRGNKRYGPQHYFGAMAAEVAELAWLWSDLEARTLETIAPPWKSTGDSKEGVVAVWDGLMMDSNPKLRARVVDDVLEFF
ncbi:hypothetical protein V8F33_011911 [Rhypophila sp. PSN 637]